VWQREWLQGEVLDKQMEYWRQQLAGAPEVLELPTDRVRPAVQSFRGETATFQLTPELSAAVQRLSREQGATLFMTLLAAFKVLLYRATGQEDIVLGAPVAGRTQSRSEALMGFFINNLVLRTSLSGDPTFAELVRRVREVTLGAYAHQEVPFDKLVEELGPRRDTGFAPLFQATFGVQNAPVEELELGELKLSYLKQGGEAVRYDLTLWVWEGKEGGISVQWRYNTDLFTREQVERLQGQYEALLSHVVSQPETSLDNLEMLTRAEKEQQQRLKLAREKSSQRKLAALKSKPVKPAKVIA
jgi:non-ribosomal peptide synthetase component F